MKTTHRFGSIIGVLAALMLGACQTMAPTPSQPNPVVVRPGNAQPLYGKVTAIDVVRQETQGIGGSTIGLGTIAGAVIGGVVGNQIGSGTGNTVATVAGAAGGAYVGHEIQNRQQADAYRITARMEDGSYQAVMQSTNTGFRVGDRVRLINGVLQRY